MNSLQRILAAVHFTAADLPPVVPQLFGHAARLCGVRLRDYGQDGALMADCQLHAQAHYRSDAVFAFMDFSMESEAIGSRLRFYDEQYPEIVDYVLPATADAAQLRLPDPTADGRLPELLRGIERLRSRLGETTLVAGSLLGPMTLATQLYGIETALFLAADNPDRFEIALDFATECAIRYGQAQIAAGAHLPVVFDPAASPAVVPPAFFRELLLPRLQRLFAALRQAGAIANWLNIAGPTATILPWYPEAGADIATFDYYVSPEQACRLLPQTCLVGNIKPLDFLDVNPERITGAARQLLTAFRERGGFILSSGCEIPPESAPANIAALVAARDGE